MNKWFRLMILVVVFSLVVTIGVLSIPQEGSPWEVILLTVVFAPAITYTLALSTEDFYS